MILNNTQHAFAQHFSKGKLQAKKLYSSWMKSASSPLPALNEKKLFAQFNEVVQYRVPEVARRLSTGGVEKFWLRFADGKESESVVIPMKYAATLCISSQVGCRMGCSFCQTGRMGLVRNLTPEEIVAQVFTAKTLMGYPIRNLVFMGMGEPLDNFDNVLAAIQILSDDAGLAIAKSRITISTSGRIDGIKRLKKEADPAIKLAISVNAPNDAIRTKLMPVNRRYNMAALKEALIDYGRPLLAEYVLIQGINDSLQAAEELSAWLQGLHAKVNLIPYNPQSNPRFQPPHPVVVEAFMTHLRRLGHHTLLRTTKGDAIMAACGQLGGLSIS